MRLEAGAKTVDKCSVMRVENLEAFSPFVAMQSIFPPLPGLTVNWTIAIMPFAQEFSISIFQRLTAAGLHPPLVHSWVALKGGLL